MDQAVKVKFKGKIYDAREDSFGHIWWDGNQWEHIPAKGVLKAKTYFHSFKQTAPGSWRRTSKESTAKVEIIRGED